MNESVLNKMCEVYSVNSRCYDYRSDQWVSQEDAYEIMKKAVPKGYNDFKANIIMKFPDDTQFQLAREGSVCVYVRGNELPSKEYLEANEYDNDGEVTRIWWD
jgi:hypothetical protein